MSGVFGFAQLGWQDLHFRNFGKGEDNAFNEFP
jgi:hypothetical protein